VRVNISEVTIALEESERDSWNYLKKARTSSYFFIIKIISNKF
jgi:hypothetical protein